LRPAGLSSAASEAGPACAVGYRALEAGWSVMQAYLAEYMPILIFLAIAIGLAVIIIGASLFVAPQHPDREKLSSYECGFEPFEDARGRFDVRFYLVAILFIIFDLEVAFLFPWAVSLGNIGLFGFWSMMVFLAVLTVGFIYEWRKGALEWE
jgi:NADH-quinone oxidoreductase subunit A